MKIEAKKLDAEPAFRPVEVKILLETESDLDGLLRMLEHGLSHLQPDDHRVELADRLYDVLDAFRENE